MLTRRSERSSPGVGFCTGHRFLWWGRAAPVIGGPAPAAERGVLVERRPAGRRACGGGAALGSWGRAAFLGGKPRGVRRYATRTMEGARRAAAGGRAGPCQRRRCCGGRASERRPAPGPRPRAELGRWGPGRRRGLYFGSKSPVTQSPAPQTPFPSRLPQTFGPLPPELGAPGLRGGGDPSDRVSERVSEAFGPRGRAARGPRDGSRPRGVRRSAARRRCASAAAPLVAAPG
jgi:hypothetical protein